MAIEPVDLGGAPGTLPPYLIEVHCDLHAPSNLLLEDPQEQADASGQIVSTTFSNNPVYNLARWLFLQEGGLFGLMPRFRSGLLVDFLYWHMKEKRQSRGEDSARGTRGPPKIVCSPH